MSDVHGEIEGVRYAMQKGKWYFGAKDIVKKFALKNMDELKKSCPNYMAGTKLENGDWAINFSDLMQVAKNCKNIPMDFVDGLFDRVRNHKDKKDEAQPDFNNPAEAARAWAAQYEMRKAAEAAVEKAEERLGDGREYKIVRAIPWINMFFNTDGNRIYGLLGLKLTHLSKKMGYKVHSCDFGYPTKSRNLHMYHVHVIRELARELQRVPDLYKDYRKHQ